MPRKTVSKDTISKKNYDPYRYRLVEVWISDPTLNKEDCTDKVLAALNKSQLRGTVEAKDRTQNILMFAG